MSYKGYTMDDVINNTALQDFQASFTGVAAGVVIQSVTEPFAIETMILFNQIEAQHAESPGSVPMSLRTQLAEYYQMAWGVNNAGSPNVAAAFGLISAACAMRYNA